MSSPESDDPTAGTDRSGDPPRPPRRANLPEDVDAEFAAIVASWAATDAPRWPGTEAGEKAARPDQGPADGERASGIGLVTPPGGAPRVEPPTPSQPMAPPEPPAADGPRVEPPRTAPDDAPPGSGPTVGPAAGPTLPGPRDHTVPEPDEHFVPPDPPPLPRIGASSVVGLVLLVIGVVLLAVPGMMGGALGLVPGLLAMTAGLGWLVFGLRRPSERRDGSGPDEHGEV